jgi:hypothetical protein
MSENKNNRKGKSPHKKRRNKDMPILPKQHKI